MYRNFLSVKRLPAGVFDGKHYLFISTPDVKDTLTPNLLLEGEKISYLVKSVETYRVKNNDLYVWAVLTAYTKNTGDSYEQYN